MQNLQKNQKQKIYCYCYCGVFRRDQRVSIESLELRAEKVLVGVITRWVG